MNQTFFFTIIWTVLFILFAGCEDEDGTPPKLSFLNLSPDEVVWNTVPVTLKASDEGGLTALKVYVDGVQIKTFHSPPYEFNWRTSSVSDGEHILRAIAIDRHGNSSEASLQIHVQNALLELNVKDDQLINRQDESEKGFIFLSNDLGQLIAFSEYKNGDITTLRDSTFNGATFFLSECIITEVNGLKTMSIVTYEGIPRGQWSLDYKKDAHTCDAKLHFVNSETTSKYFISSESDIAHVDQPDVSLGLGKSPAEIFVLNKPVNAQLPALYGIYNGIIMGENTIDLNLANKTMKKSETLLPFGSASVSIIGFRNVDSFNEFFSLGFFSSSSSKLEFYYPENEFANLFFYFSHRKDGLSLFSGSKTPQFEIKPLSNSYSFSIANDVLNYSATGDFDHAVVLMGSPFSACYRSFMIAPGTNKKLPKFDIPFPIKNFGIEIPQTVMPYSVGFFDYEGIDDYADLIKQKRSSPIGMTAVYNGRRNYVGQYYEH